LAEWDSVQCFEDAEPSFTWCVAKRGRYAIPVYRECETYDDLYGPETSSDVALTLCGSGPDSQTGWDEVMCYLGSPAGACYGRRGEWWTAITADCGDLFTASLVPLERFGGGRCGPDADAAGFDEIACGVDLYLDPTLASDPNSGAVYCYGRVGQYWITDPLICAIEQLFEGLEEVDLSSVGCD
jgi:hypothetical protein